MGWGSKQLINFLASIGTDTSVELSHYDVTSIVMKYVDEKKLLHPKRKKMVVCDQGLHSLLRRKLVNKHRIHDLLEPHFADNLNDSEEDDEGSSDAMGEKVPTRCKRKGKQSSDGIQNCKEVISRSIMASIIPENIKLVYLKRSLVEELLKQSETFETKVIGSFVRVKSDPNDYMQQNSHQLGQVTSIEKQPSEGVDKQIVLHVSNMPTDISIHMLSDSDFTKEECKQLDEHMKHGLHKKLAVVELENKAKILHEDITKHWIVKELALLKNRIDTANEKGRRREFMEYVERRKLLLQPSEQLRLTQKIPEVITDDAEPNVNSANSNERSKLRTNPSSKDSYGMRAAGDRSDGEETSAVIQPDSGEHEDDKKTKEPRTERHETREIVLALVCKQQSPLKSPVIGEQRRSVETRSTSKENLRPCDMVIPQEKLLKTFSQQPLEEKCSWSQTGGSSEEPQQNDVLMNETKLEVPHKEPLEEIVSVSMERIKKGTDEPHNMVVQKNQGAVQMIDLSDDDDNEEHEKRMKTVRHEPAQNESNEWYCMGPLGDIRGPYPMSVLKCWNDKIFTVNAAKFKVWKVGQGPENAIPLPDAFCSVSQMR